MLGGLKRMWEAGAPARALIRSLPGASIPLTVLVVAVTAASGLAPLAFTISTGALVGSVGEALADGTVSRSETTASVGMTVLAAALFALPQLLSLLRTQLITELGTKLEDLCHQRAMAAVAGPAGIAHLEDPETLNELARARGLDGSLAPIQGIYGLSEVSDRYIVGVGSVVIVASWKWWIGLGLIVVFTLTGSRVAKALEAIVGAYSAQAAQMRRSDYLRSLALGPEAAKEIRVFGLGGWLRDRHHRNHTAVLQNVWTERGKAMAAIYPVGLLTTGLCGLAFIFAVWEGLRGALSLSALVVVSRSVLAVGVLGNRGNSDYLVKAGSATIPALSSLEQRVQATTLRESGSLRPTPGAPHSSIRFENLSFAYPGREPVFDGLDLEISAGESLAIVGSNGAGKTTLIKLLARLYDPDQGRILVDGTDLRDFNPRAWQKQVAAIFQDFVKYRLSARDNVLLSEADDPETEAGVERAAERAGISQVIRALPLGWRTPMDRNLTDGAELSGGEWQRLALARALLAAQSGAGILVLDEPTASLDVRAEAEFYERFLDVTSGLTCVVISHRFSTVRKANRIVVLEHGRVVEDGTHADLMALDGRYARSYNLQASRFSDGQPESEVRTTGLPA